MSQLWISTRQVRRPGDADWDRYVEFIGLAHLREVRSIDAWCNPCLDGNYTLATLEELWEFLDLDILPQPTADEEYVLMFTDAAGPYGSVLHPRLRLLGYDLSDETWTSTLLNCGCWQGVLEPIARRAGDNGLLTLEDAMLAQRLLPQVRPDDPHAHVTVWALYEVGSGEA